MPAVPIVLVAFPPDRPAVAAPVLVAVDAAGAWRIAPDDEHPGPVRVDLSGDAGSRTAETLRALCAALGFGEAGA